jgi:hypothetical protein
MSEQKNQIENDENGGPTAADGALSDGALEQVAGGTLLSAFTRMLKPVSSGASPSEAAAATASPSQLESGGQTPARPPQ